MNIKGYLIVSPFTNRFFDINERLEFAHRVALISDDIYQSTVDTCRGNYAYPDPSNDLCSYNLQRVDECTSDINFSNILGTVPDDTAEIKVILDSWANEKQVQKALHVREGTTGVWEKTNETIHYTFGKNDSIYYQYNVFSTIDDHKQLVTKDCQVLIMSGDHDMIIPYVATEKWIKSLNVSIESPWKPWFVDTQVAG
ncbi:serine carboxypeptidase-like 16 [Bidens hawaiensis]|uniref:serine carboxypeptidase-like 16 n=1 Tax=Bidens hawaiensis TaxID=980011 RepID=UPI004049F6D5